jgi:hypothetical protein
LSWPVVLLCVFSTHLPFFAWRWRRTRELRYAATTLTFALLVLTYSLRVFAPDLRIGDVELHKAVRVLAWTAAAVSIGMLVRHWAGRLRGGSR